MVDARPFTIATSDISPEELENKNFPNARRGLDPTAVRRFLEEVAGQLRAARGREVELRSALAEAERRAASPELDEATLTAALGSETAKVLRAAHDAARDVLARSEQRAAEVASDAERRAVELRAAAESVFAERSATAEQEAERLVGAARARAEVLLEEARDECRSMVEEARGARRRIIDDLAARRRSLHAQLEQIRAAKDALFAIVEQAAGSVEEIRARLVGSEAAARQAAGTAGGPGAGGASGELLAGLLESQDAVEPDMADVVATAWDGAEAAVAGKKAAQAVPGDETVPGDEGAQEAGEAQEPAVTASPQADAAADEAPETGMPVPSAVDELFARIRASRAAEVAGARAVLETARPETGGTAGGSPADGEAAAGDLGAPSGRQPAAGGQLAVGDTAGDQSAAVEEPAVGEGGAGAAGDGAAGDDDEEAVPAPVARRDALLAPAVGELARAVKRALRSEQNELLAATRRLTGSDFNGVMPGDASRRRLAEAARGGLADAFSAGGGLTAELLDGNGEAAGVATLRATGAPAAEEAAVPLASALAEEVVGRIREHLEEGFTSAAGQEEAGRIVGAAYREWKGERVEQLAGDFATEAFSRGMLAAAAASGVLVRWSVAAGQPCPDCDDNALAGLQNPGESFPTGQPGPPAHTGCRCLLVPVAT